MLHEAVTPYYSPTTENFAVALSGGGDSIALLHALKDAPQFRFALIVDHGLREDSTREAEVTQRRAEEMGVAAHILRWTPGVLTSGLQEKARQARYSLMGEFCRLVGVPKLLTAHHLDDQAETLIMRYDKGTDWRGAAGMSSEVYAPIWPALAGVTLCRPLLSISKTEILTYLKENSLEWIEDPSNANRQFTRVRIRQRLKETPGYIGSVLKTAQALREAKSTEREILTKQASQLLSLSENGYAVLSGVPYPALLKHLLRLVSGTGGPIDHAQIRRALTQMRRPDFQALTLTGAQVSKFDKGFLLCRDPVAVKGRKNKELSKQITSALPANGVFIWDGRFIARTNKDEVTVAPLLGQMSKLPGELLQKVKQQPAKVRMTLPVWRAGREILGVGAGQFKGFRVECLAQQRLNAMLEKTWPIMNKNV